MSAPLRVVIVDADPLARRRVRSALGIEPGIKVMAEADDLAVGADLAASFSPALILLGAPSSAMLEKVCEAVFPSRN